MTIQNPPTWLQNTPGNVGYDAQDDRMVINSLVTGSGITSSSAFAVTQTGTPSMTVNIAAGTAFIVGTNTTYQGTYHVVNDGPITATAGASNATNPRIDLLVLRINDAQYAGALNSATVEIVPGTPAGTPVAPAAPANSIVLAELRVNANATSVVTSNITDRRPIARLNDFMQVLPTGALVPFAATAGFITSGWLLCDGSAVSRTTYSRLFSVIGTIYGAGDGSTTFTLPDLRGRAPFGYDGALGFGTYGGSKTHTLTVNEMPIHTHTQQPHNHGYYRNAGNAQFSVAGGTGWDLDLLSTTSDATAVNNNAGGGQAHNNMPPFVVMNYLIKT